MRASGAARSALWRHRDFMLLWWGQSLSGLGSAVTIVVVPLVAVSITGAGPFEVGLLGAAGSLPYLLFALPAGLVVDRAANTN